MKERTIVAIDEERALDPCSVELVDNLYIMTRMVSTEPIEGRECTYRLRKSMAHRRM